MNCSPATMNKSGTPSCSRRAGAPSAVPAATAVQAVTASIRPTASGRSACPSTGTSVAWLGPADDQKRADPAGAAQSRGA
jgi:hypothetical protein